VFVLRFSVYCCEARANGISVFFIMTTPQDTFGDVWLELAEATPADLAAYGNLGFCSRGEGRDNDNSLNT
jgi:hypothetical protein